MKKRLLFAVLLSAAAGGMLYRVSWSEEIPVDAPGQEVEDPRTRLAAFCRLNPLDPLCLIGQERPPAEAPGQEAQPPVGGLEGICIQFPLDIRCVQAVDVPPPVEAPGAELIP